MTTVTDELQEVAAQQVPTTPPKGEYPAKPQRMETRLRWGVWYALCEANGLHGDRQMGDKLGYNASTIFRLRTHVTKPSNAFIATAQHHLNMTFDDLFERVAVIETKKKADQ